MKRTLLVLMDSGRFKAFRMEESPRQTTPRLELLEEWDTSVTDRISEQVTDQAGQFSKGALSFAAVNDMADGERHNLELERRRRALKRMTERVGELLEREPVDGCYLAAGAEINHSVLEMLPVPVRDKLQKNVVANLTRLKSEDIIQHLQAAK